MSRAHAILSPSGASRWLACTPSARLEQKFPDSTGEAAREGTVAHALGELMLRLDAGKISPAKYEQELAQIEKNELFSNAMYIHARDYADFVLERLAEAKAHTKDALLEIEVRLDLREYIPEGFGTGDAIIIADGTLDLIDMKYGKGVFVDAVENKQMMVYALGALAKYDMLYGITKVHMTIYQPRMDNYSSYELSVKALQSWAYDTLRPRAKLAYEGKGEYAPGDHCRFCRAKAICKANAEYQLETIRDDFRAADLLDDEEVASILSRASSFKNWIASVETYALTAAVNEGKHWPGYKLVEGRSNRVITDAEAVAKRLKELKYTEADIWNKKLKGITDLERLLGKKGFTEELGKWVVKPQGSPTLAPLSDKRPELSSVDSAAADFADIDIE